MFGLNKQKIVAMSLLHDISETKTGDKATLVISSSKLEQKHEDERMAAQSIICIMRKFGAEHTADLFKEYNLQKSDEARFVRLLDKLLPSAVRTIIPAKTVKKEFKKQYGITSRRKLKKVEGKVVRRFVTMFSEDAFTDILIEVRKLLDREVVNRVSQKAA